MLHHFLGDSVSPSLSRREPQGSLSERVGPVVQGDLLSPHWGQTGHSPPPPPTPAKAEAASSSQSYLRGYRTLGLGLRGGQAT